MCGLYPLCLFCVWLVSVSDGDCLLSLPRPLWHRGSSRGSGPGLTITQPPLYTVLYCTVQYTHIAYHYVQLLLQSMGGTKKKAWDMGYVKNVLPTEASTVQLASER